PGQPEGRLGRHGAVSRYGRRHRHPYQVDRRAEPAGAGGGPPAPRDACRPNRPHRQLRAEGRGGHERLALGGRGVLMIEVVVKVNGKEVAVAEIENTRMNADETADYLATFEVDRMGARGRHRRMLYGFPRT